MEADLNVEAAGFAWLQVEASVVSIGDGLHNREAEAEAEAVMLACPVIGEALEWREETARLCRGYDRSGVRDLKHGVIPSGTDGNEDDAPRVVVVQGVVEEVRHQPLGKGGVPGEGGRVERHVKAYLTARGGRLAGADDLARDGGQVDGLPMLEALLASGQREEGLDELLLLLARFEEVLADRPVRIDGGVGVGKDHFEQRPFDGDGGAELVRRVGGESPLGVERLLQAGKEPVDRVAEVC